MSLNLESTFLFHNPLVYLGNFLSDFVSTLAFPAEVKDAKTGIYSLANQASAKRFGLSPGDFGNMKLTVRDIGTICKVENETIEKIIYLDEQTYTEALTSIHKKHYLTHDGFVMIDEGTKKPVFGKTNEVIAILSYGHDITPYADLLYLYSLYRYHYPKPRQAIEKLLKYLKIDGCFTELPTKHELITLLSMRQTTSSKYISTQLKVSPRTVDEHRARLRAKLKIIGLSELLVKMRTRNEYKDIE